MGRPSKRTPEREQRLLDALRAGNTRRAAALYAGFTPRTLERWMLRSVAFVAAIEKAEADAEVRHVANIARASADTWQASAWWLERRRPDDYGRRDRIELTIRQQAERLAAEFGLDPEALIMEAERIAASA